MKVIQLKVAETNKYYNQYLDTPDSDGRTILYNILYQHNEMLQVSSHTVIPTFYWQYEPTRQEWQ
jgi:hypothetical protein